MKTTLRITFICLFVLSAALFANAQTVDKKTLTIEGAKKVIAEQRTRRRHCRRR